MKSLMNTSKKILLTGGGTAGHVTPNLALVPKLRAMGYDILYVGSKNGIEKELVAKAGIPFQSISTGKLRRYFDLKNFTDPFRVIKGFFDARKILKQFMPNIVFSKGGFVAVPVVFAASMLKIPVISHESDLTPGLANKLSIQKSSKICCNFPETLAHLPKEKAELTGSPMREELFTGSAQKGKELTKFTKDLPTLMIIGGSLGSVKVNNEIRKNLDMILSEFNLIHLCGKGNVDHELDSKNGYIQFEYVDDDLKHLFALSDIVISRAGANAICELLALKKPNILIPLSAAASRGDQILNATSFEKQGFSYLLREEDLDREHLQNAIHTVFKNREHYIQKMDASTQSNGIKRIIELIEQYAK